ncbi:MAG: methyltransferase [Usitatibacteraceae bacterium]
MNSPPIFPKHDPASPEFWDVRFDAAFTPWDQGGVPKSLANYVARERTKRKVLIPGCGAAYEVRFFAELAWDVVAIDFSASAVAHAKRLLGQLADHVREDDFFGETLGRERFDVIYERAFMCALPKRLRAAWAARVAELIPANGRLIGLFFFGSSEKGPPFAIARAELVALLSPHFALVEESVPTDSIAVFAGGERWQVWQRLP